MGYKPGIPLSTDYIAQSQQDFINNFETVNKTYGLSVTPTENVGDHVALTETSEELIGKHKKTTLIKQAADPTVAASECALYSKGTPPNIYYRRDGDASGNQLTSNGRISVGGLILRAYVLFDWQGNILNNSIVDSDGNKTEVPIKHNITSIVQGTAGKADWTVNFTDTIGTADYFWVAQALTGKEGTLTPRGYFQVKGAAAYATSVAATFIKLAGYEKNGTLLASFNVPRIYLQVYTVA